MKIFSTENYEEMSRAAATIIAEQIAKKTDSVLGLATGGSVVGIYRQLVGQRRENKLNFSLCKTVNLDEYCGLSPNSRQSYAWFMNEHLFEHININMANVNILNGLNTNEQEETSRYDEIIRVLGGIDLQLLGLGHNGHIGFNEPACFFEKSTHKVTLAKDTIDANKRFFENEAEVPRYAYTMGICDIMQAKHVLMVVSGKDKAEIVKEAFFGAVTPNVPASIMQFHSNFTLVADKEALSLCPLADHE